MTDTEILIIGGGPAGLCAAIAIAEMGGRAVLADRNADLGGQLVKQTHMFFGSQKQYASTRGIDIAEILIGKIRENADKIRVMPKSTVLGVYEDGVVTVENDKKYIKIRPKAIIAATGAAEKFLAFPGNDLPGVYGAGAVQTLMNVHGVLPGKNAVMVGAGNIGLIVSYQLAQAGIRVRAVVDAAPAIGGFLVHASKIRRMGIPIYTGYTVKHAHGRDSLESVTLVKLDENWRPVGGSEITIEADICCVSVGLSPLCELMWQAGCDMRYVPELGGHVPVRDANLRTSAPNIFVAGDAAGVEEASSAMVEGRLAGLMAARALGHNRSDFDALKDDCAAQLHDLRSGPAGEKILAGVKKVETGGWDNA